MLLKELRRQTNQLILTSVDHRFACHLLWTIITVVNMLVFYTPYRGNKDPLGRVSKSIWSNIFLKKCKRITTYIPFSKVLKLESYPAPSKPPGTFNRYILTTINMHWSDSTTNIAGEPRRQTSRRSHREKNRKGAPTTNIAREPRRQTSLESHRL